ncbi:MAG: CHAT domain-containing protein [Coleofasciculaceae cyanobacterium]
MAHNRVGSTTLKFCLMLAPLSLLGTLGIGAALAEPITSDGTTNTNVTPDGNTIEITGGELSGDGQNLFHSFSDFGLTSEQIANFISNPNIENILSRITGGNLSVIDGLLQVSGGNSNLFLMNPAGILFGPNARLDLPASFTATTATGIGFNEQWFNASGTNNYAALVGTPNLFDFNTLTPGAIINAGQLEVNPQQNITLLGGTVVSTGQLTAEDGQVTIATVPGNNLVRLSQPGHLLSLEVTPSSSPSLTPISLPQLLTGGNADHARGLTVNNNGEVVLTGSEITLESGDVAVNRLNSGTALLSADQNLKLVESQLQTTGNLQLRAGDTVVARDSPTNPFLAHSGGDLLVEGKNQIDILTLNHPEETSWQSSGNLSLISDGLISGDAHFQSSGNFSVLNLSEQPGNFVSFFDPVITVGADYNVGDYTGAALKVTAGGTITGGAIVITRPDNPATIPANDPDFVTLTTTPALILRAGGDIQLGSVNTSSNTPGIDAGPVILEAMGDVKVFGEIVADSTTDNGGDVNVTATNGNIEISTVIGRGIRTFGLNGGDINLTAGGTIGFLDAISEGTAVNGTGGNINISAGADVISDDIQTRGSVGAGNITVTSSNGNIDTRRTSGTRLGTDGSIASCLKTAAAFCAGGNVGDITLNAPNGGIFLGGSQVSDPNATNTVRGNNITLNSPEINLTIDRPITAIGEIILNGNLNTVNGNGLTLAGNLRLAGNASINTQGGNILLDGTVDGTTPFNENLNLNAGGGTTTFNGSVGSNTSLNVLSTDAGGTTVITNNILNARRLEFNDPVNFALNPTLPPQVTLTADETVFGSTVTGVGIDLVLQPSAAGSNFTLNSATTPEFVDGFNSITIGRADGTGQIDIDGEVSFSDPVTIRSPFGTINVNENLSGVAEASVTLEAATTNLNADIDTVGQNINLNSNLLLADDVELNSNGGIITFNGTVDGNQNLTVNSGNGTTVFNNNVGAITGLNSISTDPGGTTVVNGNLTANLIDFNDPLTINNSILTATEIDLGSTVNGNGDINLNAPTIKLNANVGTNEEEDINLNGNVELEEDIALNGGNINFNGNVNGDQNLVITTFGGGTTTFNGDVGNVTALNTLSTDPLGNTVLGNNSNLTAQFLDFKGTLQLLSDSTLTADQIDFGGNVTGTNESDLVLQPLTLTQDIAIAGTDNNTPALDLTAAELAQLQDGFASLTIGSSAGTGNIAVNASQFSDPVTFQTGGLIAVNGALTGTDDASITLNSPTTALNANLTTDNADINLESNVDLGNNIILNSGGGNITFNGTVDSTNNQNLTVNGGGGVTTFNGAVGSNNPLNILRTEGGGTTRVNNSLATNILDFSNNALEIGVADSTLRATQMNLGTTVSGSGDLKLQALQPSGNLNLSGTTTFANGFSSVTIGEEQGSGVISLAGDFRFNDPVSILSPQDDGSIAVNGTLTGLGDASLSLRANQNITTEDITSEGSAITLTSEDGGITSGNLNSALGTGGITVSAEDNIITGNITSNGSAITLISDDGDIQTGNLNSVNESDGIVIAGIAVGDITVSAEDNLITGDITSNGSDITLISDDGNIQAGNLNSSSDSNGGNIRASANDGAVTLGNLNSSGVSGGGNIEVEAQIEISTGEINSSATDGNAGNVSLDPDNDIEVVSINAQGGINGRGGDVDIETRQFFRASGTFTDQTGAVASISTAGGAGGGDITIRHAGGFRDVPFTVRPNYNGRNGTAGVISTGSANQITLGEYPFLFEQPGPQGDIRLITLPETLPETAPNLIERPDTNLPTEENFTLDESVTEPIDPPEKTEAVSIDPFFDDFDSYFTQQFESYLGLDKVKVNSLNQVRERLEQLEKIPGVKSALIYARFVPNQDLLQESSNRENDQLELLLVTSSREMVYKRVGVTRAQVIAVANQFRLSVTNWRNEDGYLRPGQQLHQWLIAPLEEDLQAQGIDNLVFILDKGLRSVPVAAIHDGKQFLVEQYSISLMPSFSLTNTDYHDIKESQILAMGADRFVNNKPLPSVPVELRVITQRLWQGKSFLNNTFTFQNLKAQRAAKSFGIIHLATHADFQPGDPSLSYIQLWDRKLSLDELPKLGLDKPPVDLLVLSACRTALGNEEAELGFSGLAVRAGVKSSLGSFWYVSDQGTLALMTEFYDQLDMTITKADALRQAQLAMLKGQVKLERTQLVTPRENIALPPELSGFELTNMRHPYYWAGFSLVGNPW